MPHKTPEIAAATMSKITRTGHVLVSLALSKNGE